MRLIYLFGVSAFLLSGLSGCSANHEARTPREFIEKYSRAWKNGDVETILGMQKRKDLRRLDVSPKLQDSLEEASLEDEKEQIKQSIKRKDFAYTAWTNTDYVAEREHDDHIHVEVRVDNARSEVILVREGEFLKIHLNPGRFR